MNTKSLMAAGFALAFTLSAPVFASDTIEFDADGDGAGILDVGTLDWAVGSTLSVNVIDTTNNTIQEGDIFDAYTHAALATTNNPAGTPVAPSGLNTDFEITFIAGFTELVTNVGTPTLAVCSAGVCESQVTVNFALADAVDQNVNFFEIYYDDFASGGVQSDALAGTGYDDGQLILRAELVELSGTFTTTFEWNDDGDGILEAGETLVTVALDNFGTDQWGNQQTVEGEGGTTLRADVMFQDTDFFITDISSLVQDLFFNTSNVVPFGETQPSNLFDTDGCQGVDPTTCTTGVNTAAPSIGEINGFSGPDFLLQTDANQSFVTTVPEPNTVLLFALGLLLLGSVSRSHYFRRGLNA